MKKRIKVWSIVLLTALLSLGFYGTYQYAYQTGYDQGYSTGTAELNSKTKAARKAAFDIGYNEGYNRGYNAGYDAGRVGTHYSENQSGFSRESRESPSDTAVSQTVYITNTGEKYHRSSCSYLRQSKIAIPLSSAKSKGYTACSRCNPPP